MSEFSKTDELYMRRCLQLARCGTGSTSPNPAVGAVIVCDGRIIGEGYHIRAGEPHAEVNAVRSVSECDKKLLTRSTIYVSLEPCSHYGKTPPCADLIISCGIPRVVVGVTDYNSQVNGGGIARLRAAGAEVVVGVLAGEAFAVNEKFFTNCINGRPHITLKWAQSADGYIDAERSSAAVHAVKISNPVSLVAMHRERARHDAILVGTNTALLDNPSLDVRYWGGRSPLRLVVDRCGTLPVSLKLFDGSRPTVVFTAVAKEGKFGKNVEQVALDFSKDILPQVVEYLAARKVGSLLVEGGARLLQSFIDSALWDAARVEVNPLLFLGGGVAAPLLPGGCEKAKFSVFGNEIMLYTPKKAL
jgi:diaminohydroxyphosphoribosylaminopyrimidine deaminase/5-amino-6-(5-phosphoribosylamino)uracil reductase